jgi:lipid-binding SYLF domain-containing protein
MKRKFEFWRAGRTILVFSVIVLSLSIFHGIFATRATADDVMDARRLADRARLTLETFMQVPETQAFRNLVVNARGVFIAPQILRGAFVVGGSGGSGVYLVRDMRTNSWSGPAFYTLGGVSFGFQIGGEASEVVFLAMTERGVNALLKSGVKLGADVGVAVGPIGLGADASTANLSVDVLTFSRSKGLYGGISLAGSVVYVRDDWNTAYYGLNVIPADILISRTVSNRHATGLLDLVARAVGGQVGLDTRTPETKAPESRVQEPNSRAERETPVQVEDIDTKNKSGKDR